MPDCDNQELKIGDRVAVQYKHYKELSIMYVVGFTLHKVVVAVCGEADIKKARKVDAVRLAKLYKQEV